MHLRWPGLLLSSALALLAPGCAAPQTGCRLHAAYSGMCAEELAKGNLEAAEAYCDQGMALYLEYADLWYHKGLISMAREDWGAAKYFMATALRYDPGHPGAHSQLGVIFMQEGGYEKARESFREALKVNPEAFDSRYGLALAFMELGQEGEARTELAAILAASAEVDATWQSASAHHTLGVLDYRARNLEGAISHLSQGVKLAPDRPELWQDLGTALKEQGRLAEAAEAFGHCVRLDEKQTACREGLEAAP